ncbi:hypothetical protein ACFY8W_11255 [Streptomyces sp. NPDC012637]|uniref:hypothetical protein n=1 Tax=Streptomyces sp. NPDC012637 TaxID=3364842 RepID=UPI0036EB7E77
MQQPPVTAPRSAPYTALLATLTLVLSLLLPILPVGTAGVARAADVPDLTDCVTVPVNDYGSAPTAAASAANCKAFTAPTTGPYDVFGVEQPEGRRVRLAVYDAAGAAVCAATEGVCRLTAGDTYRVATGDPALILDRSSQQGCVPAAPGALNGAIEAAGAIDCLTLSLPEGAHVEALTPRGSDDMVEVVDGTGTRICAAGGLADRTCELTGPAPHRALVSTGSDYAPVGEYRLALYRTDVPNDCPVVPAGDFTPSSARASVPGAADVFAYCFTIPADDRPRTEFVRTEALDGEWVSTGPNQGHPTRYSWAEHSVLDAKGVRVCDSTCALAPGAAHTVLVRTEPRDGFSVVRRDLTGTVAGCAEQPAVPVGGPSKGGALGISGTVTCHQVTTEDAGDVLYLDYRSYGGGDLAVFDEAGRRTVCTSEGCTVTGGTRYKAVVTAPHSSATSYRLDALRIATPSGPAPECAKALNLRDGYGPISGTLDEEHTAVCVSLATASDDDLWLWVRDPAGTATTADATLWNAGLNETCTREAGGYHCKPGDGTTPAVPAPTVLVLGLPSDASQVSYRADVDCSRSVKRRCGVDPVSFSSVSPSSAPRGSLATLTVHGTALSTKDKVVLKQGETTLSTTPVGVSPDGRSLTVTVGLSVATPGDWSVRVYSRGVYSGGMEYVIGTFTVTPPVSGLGSYAPLTPTRLMDTRTGIGVEPAKVGPGGTVTLQVTGRKGIPSTGVSAVVLNVTATAPTAAGFVSVYPDGTARTSASNLNFKAGQTIPNLVVVPVVNGKVNFYNRAGSVDLIADAAGYYVTDGSGATYKPVTPSRVMDTRAGLGVPRAKVGAQQSVTLKVSGSGGLPATGVTAVVLNVTATAPTAASFVSVHPADRPRTSASNLNFTAGQTIPNLVVVPVGANGEVTFYNHAGTVDLIADVAGYFTMDATGSAYRPMTPSRLMDTRSGTGVAQAKVGGGKTVTLQVAGAAGIPASGVTAVVLNVTAVAPTAAGFVSVYPDGTVRTSASNLNFTAGTTIPNLVVVPVVNGKVSFYNHAGDVDLLADVAGYYVS